MDEHRLKKVRQHDPEAIQVIGKIERKINFFMTPAGFLDEIFPELFTN